MDAIWELRRDSLTPGPTTSCLHATDTDASQDLMAELRRWCAHTPTIGHSCTQFHRHVHTITGFDFEVP